MEKILVSIKYCQADKESGIIWMGHNDEPCSSYNPVEAGFVTKPTEWIYSSAIDYYVGMLLLKIIKSDTLIV